MGVIIIIIIIILIIMIICESYGQIISMAFLLTHSVYCAHGNCIIPLYVT